MRSHASDPPPTHAHRIRSLLTEPVSASNRAPRWIFCRTYHTGFRSYISVVTLTMKFTFTNP